MILKSNALPDRLRSVLRRLGTIDGVWYGIGLQWPPAPLVTRTWLRTVLPPYMRGVGINLSVWRFSVRLGVFRNMGTYVLEDYDNVDVDGEVEAAGWGLDAREPEVIGTWQQQRQPSSTPSGLAPESPRSEPRT